MILLSSIGKTNVAMGKSWLFKATVCRCSAAIAALRRKTPGTDRLLRNLTEDTFRDPEAADRFLASWTPFEEHVNELAKLGLLEREYTIDDYQRELEKHLRIEIREVQIPFFAHGDDSIAHLDYDEERRLALLWIRDDLSIWLYQYTVLHESAHLAAGHNFRNVSRDGTVQRHRSPVGDRLARRPPICRDILPDNLKETISDSEIEWLCEREADQRAEHGMVTVSLGRHALEIDGLNQIH